MPSDRHAHLSTEARNPRSLELDRLPLEAALDLVQREDVGVHAALFAARGAILEAIECVVGRLRRGGRLVYVGAGTSGRLALLDAVECPPTFQSDPDRVQAVLAGGPEAFARAREGAEDDAAGAARALAERSVGPDDCVFGIAASGTTPFVHGAIAHAKGVGAATVFLACVPFEEAPDEADVSIRVPTGPEVLTGSTRLKAGTATKLVLNAVSTLAMVRLGKVHENLMVDVQTRGNAKLAARGARIVAELTGLASEAARDLLESAGGQVKVAVLMQRLGLDATAARERLERHRGILREALGG